MILRRRARVPLHSRRRCRGQVAIEATVIALVVVLVLFIGEPSPLEQLLDAIRRVYARFSYAIALP